MAGENGTGSKNGGDAQSLQAPDMKDRALALALLAQGETVKETAAKIGVSERTIYNWKRDPEFRYQLDEASEALVDTARRRLAYVMPSAVTVVATHLKNGSLKAASEAREMFKALLTKSAPVVALGVRGGDGGPQQVTISALDLDKPQSVALFHQLLKNSASEGPVPDTNPSQGNNGNGVKSENANGNGKADGAAAPLTPPETPDQGMI